MQREILVRYQKESLPQPRFEPGDVVFLLSQDSLNKISRYSVDSVYPGEVYMVTRLDDLGLKKGNSVRLNSSVSSRFEKDEMVTNLLNM